MVITGGVLAWFVGFWYVLPIVLRHGTTAARPQDLDDASSGEGQGGEGGDGEGRGGEGRGGAGRDGGGGRGRRQAR
jgi:hypothetical protein